MSDEPFSLGQLYGAIEQHIKDAIPGLQYVGTMPHMLQEVALPAVVIELVEFEPALDQLTGQTAVQARFEARVIVAAEQEDCEQQAAFGAAQLAVLLRLQTWGLEVEPAEFVRAGRDWTRPELDTMAVWAVEWIHVLYLGLEEWPWPNQPPGTLVFNLGEGVGNVRPEELT
ncbi:hypothetical protein VP719_11800 [Pseudomonas protegens]|uniref:hypothetical protein n=1 Tax=Pseudomonas protegens TaxID=380021 RepID=UPI002DB92A4A|nr:hypothetical protein [Pseudomonas protegens]WRV93700.1 hypothetical protein VP719_11800 [Pseudomonas protegens]